MPNLSDLLIDLVNNGFKACIPSMITIPFYGKTNGFVFSLLLPILKSNIGD